MLVDLTCEEILALLEPDTKPETPAFVSGHDKLRSALGQPEQSLQDLLTPEQEGAIFDAAETLEGVDRWVDKPGFADTAKRLRSIVIASSAPEPAQ